MPTIPWKNGLYRLMLPLWAFNQPQAPIAPLKGEEARKIFDLCQKHHVVGAQLLLFEGEEILNNYTYGYSRLPDQPVGEDTFFRLASITKLVLALGALTLVEDQKIGLKEDLRPIFSFLINPGFKGSPITLYNLLTHTSSIIDGPLYQKSLGAKIPLDEVLLGPGSFSSRPPGEVFAYSNLTFGIIGSLVEAVSGLSLEDYMQTRVFRPLQMRATFALNTLPLQVPVAANYKVLTKERGQAQISFNPDQRRKNPHDFHHPNPHYHYVYGPGGLYSTSQSLARLFTFFNQKGAPLIGEELFDAMVTTKISYGLKNPNLYQGLGLLKVNDPRLCPSEIWGHQGFAYGVAQGFFYNPVNQRGIVSLNSGCSLYRKDRLSTLSRGLIQSFL